MISYYISYLVVFQYFVAYVTYMYSKAATMHATELQFSQKTICELNAVSCRCNSNTHKQTYPIRFAHWSVGLILV